jgi:hypothetical protein
MYSLYFLAAAAASGRRLDAYVSKVYASSY